MKVGFEVKARSLKDQTLNTGLEVRELIKGEVFLARYKNQQVFECLIELGILQKVSSAEPLQKKIPVVFIV